MRATPVPASALPPLYTAVGELVVNWSILESLIVKTIAVIYQNAGGKHIQPQIPVAFKRQMKFLRLCFKRVATLSPHAAEANGILSKARELSFIRNTVIHGAVSGYDRTSKKYTFHKLDVDDKERLHLLNSVTTTLSDLRGATVEIQRITDRALILTNEIADAFLR